MRLQTTKPKAAKPANVGGTNRLGAPLQVQGTRDWIDPIEYAQTALRQEYASRLAHYERQRRIR